MPKPVFNMMANMIYYVPYMIIHTYIPTMHSPGWNACKGIIMKLPMAIYSTITVVANKADPGTVQYMIQLLQYQGHFYALAHTDSSTWTAIVGMHPWHVQEFLGYILYDNNTCSPQHYLCN